MNLLPEQTMTQDELAAMSSLALAHIGDAVYELLARTSMCVTGKLTSGGLHRATVAVVSANAQAEAARRIAEHFTEEEAAVYRRGRNARVNSVPRGSSYEQYHAATALEALFGYLYLKGRLERVIELFELCRKEPIQTENEVQ